MIKETIIPICILVTILFLAGYVIYLKESIRLLKNEINDFEFNYASLGQKAHSAYDEIDHLNRKTMKFNKELDSCKESNRRLNDLLNHKESKCNNLCNSKHGVEVSELHTKIKELEDKVYKLMDEQRGNY